MKILLAILAVVALAVPILAQGANKIFPYKYHTDDLPNGLRLITVPTDYPNIVALYIVVTTGRETRSSRGSRASLTCSST